MIISRMGGGQTNNVERNNSIPRAEGEGGEKWAGAMRWCITRPWELFWLPGDITGLSTQGSSHVIPTKNVPGPSFCPSLLL